MARSRPVTVATWLMAIPLFVPPSTFSTPTSGGSTLTLPWYVGPELRSVLALLARARVAESIWRALSRLPPRIFFFSLALSAEILDEEDQCGQNYQLSRRPILQGLAAVRTHVNHLVRVGALATAGAWIQTMRWPFVRFARSFFALSIRSNPGNTLKQSTYLLSAHTYLPSFGTRGTHGTHLNTPHRTRPQLHGPGPVDL